MTNQVQRSGKSRCPRKVILRLAAVLVVTAPVALAYPADDPESLQKQGIQRVDQYIECVHRTGDLVSLIPELHKAQNELTASSRGFLARQDFAGAALSFIKLGDIERLQNHWDSALPLYIRARELAKQANHSGYQAKALTLLTRTEVLGSGDLGAAAEYIAEAIRLATEAGNKDYLFDALDQAGELEVKRGNLNAAADYLDRALAMKDELQDKALLLYGYMDRADIYYNRGAKCDYERNFDICDQAFQLSHTDYEQALGIARSFGLQFIAANLQDLLQGSDARRKLIQSQATSKYRQGVAGATSVLLHPKKASDVLVTQQFTGGPDPASQAQLQGLLPQFNSADPRSLYIQGMSEEMKGNNDAALADYRKAIELLERDRRKLRDDQSRGTFLEDKIHFYYSPILLLLDLGRQAEAFDLMERSRSRAMVDLLVSSPLTLRTPQERELFSESMKLKTEIAVQQKKLFGMTAGSERAKHASEISGIEAEIGKLEKQLQKVQARITRETPKVEELTVSQPISLESIQRSAKLEGYDLLYYLVQEFALIIWDINAEGVKVLNVFSPRSEVMAKVAALRNSLVAREKNVNAKFDEQTSRELFLFLIQPVMKFVKTRHFVIVPHEDLNNLPFQVLQDPADGTYLGERFQISYAPSATVLASLKKRSNLRDGRLLAVADPGIVDATKEVEAVGRLYQDRSKIVKDVPVKKEDVKAWVAGYDLIHLSVHGVFNAQDPLLSYLKLTPTDQDNGRLTAAEMFGLPLAKDSFVVLSACETGQVEATHANEVLGMVRALLYAGANNLVLSSWEVQSEATALWMETFYRAARTNPPSEAARLALVAVKARPEYRDPYFWGPFLMTGK